jgi:hypothetical protein
MVLRLCLPLLVSVCNLVSAWKTVSSDFGPSLGMSVDSCLLGSRLPSRGVTYVQGQVCRLKYRSAYNLYIMGHGIQRV